MCSQSRRPEAGQAVRQALSSGVEMNYARELSHVNVVRTLHVYQQIEPVYQFDDNASSPVYEVSVLWMVQEFCDMGDLRRCMKTFFGAKSKERWKNTLDVLQQILHGLTYLHSQGIVHADLKAENVVLMSSTTTSTGFVAKVADFGMAKFLKGRASYYSDKSVIGDLAYIAPEARGEQGRVSPEIDTYSFGMLMYELACNIKMRLKVPGQANSEGTRPVFPDGIDLSYQSLAARCWHEDPVQRPSDSELLAELMSIDATRPDNIFSEHDLLDDLLDADDPSFTSGSVSGYEVPNSNLLD